jgi:hypothetical protein
MSAKLPSLPPEWVAHHRANGMTPSQMAECLAEFRRGHVEACAEVRARAKTILTSENAKGREDMALHLALETDLTAEAAVGTLAAIPRAVDTSRLNRLGRAIAASGGSPNVGSEFDAPGESAESAAAVAKRITSY